MNRRLRTWLPRALPAPTDVALLACAVCALACLPAAELPRAWSATFVLPAALLGATRPRRGRRWPRLLLALVVQAGAAAAAELWSTPPTRPGGLACAILPALGFVAGRRRTGDGALGLFLAFCVLLVGTILGGIRLPWVAGFLASATLWLFADARDAAARTAGRGTLLLPVERTPLPLRSALRVVAACLCAAFVVERCLRFVPAPRVNLPTPRATSGGAAEDAHRAGLGDRFDLERGALLPPEDDAAVVIASAPEGTSLPREMYLRTGFFAVARLDQWRTGPVDTVPANGPELELRTLPAPQPLRWMHLEAGPAARELVFVPPGATVLRGDGRFQHDARREWLRLAPGTSLAGYDVGVPEAPAAQGAPFDPRAAEQGLLDLPADLDRAPLEALLDEWHAEGPPLQIAERIVAGLCARCSYGRTEPRGPHRHALWNFLFSEQGRHGTCMHFAAAAALLLRLRDVPCRIGVGLYGGNADPERPGARRFGQEHAHAWVEIPFYGRGFVVVDATPAAGRPGDEPEPEAPPAPPESEAPAASPFAVFARWLPWLLGATALAALAFAPRPDRGVRGPRAAGALPEEVRPARRQLQRLLRELASAGATGRPGRTLEQFAQELAAAGSPTAPIAGLVADAFAAYQEVRFGGRPYDTAREARLQQAIDAARGLPAAP